MLTNVNHVPAKNSLRNFSRSGLSSFVSWSQWSGCFACKRWSCIPSFFLLIQNNVHVMLYLQFNLAQFRKCFLSLLFLKLLRLFSFVLFLSWKYAESFGKKSSFCFEHRNCRRITCRQRLIFCPIILSSQNKKNEKFFKTKLFYLASAAGMDAEGLKLNFAKKNGPKDLASNAQQMLEQEKVYLDGENKKELIQRLDRIEGERHHKKSTSGMIVFHNIYFFQILTSCFGTQTTQICRQKERIIVELQKSILSILRISGTNLHHKMNYFWDLQKFQTFQKFFDGRC